MQIGHFFVTYYVYIRIERDHRVKIIPRLILFPGLETMDLCINPGLLPRQKRVFET